MGSRRHFPTRAPPNSIIMMPMPMPSQLQLVPDREISTRPHRASSVFSCQYPLVLWFSSSIYGIPQRR